jgi:3-isopropylmalate/(R)-2-methylmalate dehydratase small subunit
MQPFVTLHAIAAPLLLDNIDTDQIIPGKEVMKIETSGFGAGLFAEWRYRGGTRQEDPQFVLNREPYRRAGILLAGENFACGSSREVAAWALRDFGIRCVIAPSFGGIFHANCFRNGMLPIELSGASVRALANRVEAGQPELEVDLPAQQVRAGESLCFGFEIGALHKEMLLKGLDAIELTLSRSAAIDAFQARDRVRRPWIYLADEP